MFIFIYIYISPVGSVFPENPNKTPIPQTPFCLSTLGICWCPARALRTKSSLFRNPWPLVLYLLFLLRPSSLAASPSCR